MPATPDASSCGAQPLFVLVNTSHPGNVGAAARAVKTMGFTQLALVAPRYADVLQQPEALAFASGADDVLAATRICPDLMAAAGDCGVLVALSSRVRDFGPPLRSPEWLPELARTAASQGRRVGFVFGSERYGLDNDTVYRCDALLSLPAYSKYASLNLAQAVLIFCYELFKTAGEARPAESRSLATTGEMECLYGQMEEVLLRIGFLNPENPAHIMRSLRRVFARAALDPREVMIMRGLLTQVDWAASSFEGKKGA